MEIRDFKIGDEDKILELFQLVFQKQMRRAYWKWRFEQNPFGKHFIKLMWDNDTLVGHYAVSPVFMKITGDRYLTSFSVSTMTHPDYGGRRIFSDLAHELYHDLENNKAVKVIWGFPNSNSHYGFVKNLGWDNVGIVHMLSMDVSTRKSAFKNRISCVNKIEIEHIALLKKASRPFSVSADYNHKYLHWRYLQHPTQKYILFEDRDRRLNAFVIVKLFKSNTTHNSYELFIMEIGFVDNYNTLSELFEGIIEKLEKPVSKINIWMSLWDARHIMLEKMGFVPSGRTTYLGSRTFRELSHIVSDMRNWHISFGLSDVY